MALKGAGDSSGRPKRYSSLRQRSLPETSTYQTPPPSVPPPHPSYYEAGLYFLLPKGVFFVVVAGDVGSFFPHN